MIPHPYIKDLYITPDGKVFKELGSTKGNDGYHHCTINGKQIRRHILVCETFNGLNTNGYIVRHLNGNPGDDRPENLSWGTQKENCNDTIKHNRTTKGEKNKQAKLNSSQVIEIRNRWKNNESPTFLAKEFNVSVSNIQDIVRYRTWKHLP